MSTAYLAWAAVCLIWGTTYLGIKIALETIPPFLMGGMRYGSSGAVLAAWLLARGRRLPRAGATGAGWRCSVSSCSCSATAASSGASSSFRAA